MKPYISIILLSIISSVCVQTLHAQSKFEDYFIKGGVSYDFRVIADRAFPKYSDFYLMSFWSKEIEIGKRNEQKIYSVHVRFGNNEFREELIVEDERFDTFEVERYMQLAGAFPLAVQQVQGY